MPQTRNYIYKKKLIWKKCSSLNSVKTAVFPLSCWDTGCMCIKCTSICDGKQSLSCFSSTYYQMCQSSIKFPVMLTSSHKKTLRRFTKSFSSVPLNYYYCQWTVTTCDLIMALDNLEMIWQLELWSKIWRFGNLYYLRGERERVRELMWTRCCLSIKCMNDTADKILD